MVPNLVTAILRPVMTISPASETPAPDLVLPVRIRVPVPAIIPANTTLDKNE
ncbi:hypothetical protein [Methanoregula sp. PtaB.Bin085]|uniref:hypothetical protein n=1 Tax=Methanoregula sp. PtaB.Bin085 TaxID=1811680 RepID=UPI0025CF8BA7|nr:hypothetical protein [Methanoregula sp. PtaB.Bin085]